MTSVTMRCSTMQREVAFELIICLLTYMCSHERLKTHQMYLEHSPSPSPVGQHLDFLSLDGTLDSLI
jgi:hypothetical protein